MSVSATFTIEMSTIAITAASITITVIAIFGPLSWPCMTLLRGVDGDVGAHAGTELEAAAIRDLDAHGHALRDLREVAARVVGRQQGEPCAGAELDALDEAGHRIAVVGVELHANALAGMNVRQLRLLEVGDDPQLGRADDR